MTLLSEKPHWFFLPLSLFYGCTTAYLHLIVLICRSRHYTNQINSGGYYINDAEQIRQLMVCALMQAQIVTESFDAAGV